MIYLDNAASTRLDPEVLAAMLPWMLDRYGNASSRHAAGGDATTAIEDAREQVARAIGCSDPSRIIFTSGATEANNLAIAGTWNIWVPAIEHSSVLAPAANLELGKRRIPVTAEGLVTLDALDAMADGPKWALPGTISVGMVNNEIGTLQPVGEIAAWCSERGIKFHTDAAQALGRVPAGGLDADVCGLMSVSAHKVHGPQGVGALYVGPDANIDPRVFGGGQERGLRAGTLPTALIVGFGKACTLIHARYSQECIISCGPTEPELDFGQMVRELGRRFGAEVLGVPLSSSYHPHRVGTIVCLRFPGVDTQGLLGALPELCASTGSACDSKSTAPSHVLQAIGTHGPNDRVDTIRFSTSRFTTVAEIAVAADMIAGEIDAHRIK